MVYLSCQRRFGFNARFFSVLSLRLSLGFGFCDFRVFLFSYYSELFPPCNMTVMRNQSGTTTL